MSLLVGGTRWGSYLGFGGLYLTDIALAIGVVAYFVGAHGPRARPFAGPRRPYPVLLLLLVLWSVGRLIAGADFSLIAIRDAVPYIYAFSGILAWAAYSRATPTTRSRTHRVLVGALAFHAAWYGLVLVLPDLPESLPTLSAVQDLHLFSSRPDVDTPLIGVLAALCLRHLMLRPWRRAVGPAAILVFVGCWVEVGLSATRAGLLGSALVCVLTFVFAFPQLRLAPVRQVAVLTVVPLVIAVVAVIVPNTTVGQKLLVTFGGDAATSNSAQAWGEGTARARSEAWDRLIAYDLADPTRATVGVGFGPDFMSQSGALLLLVNSDTGGDAQPRSPHNYWIGTLSRNGIVGLGIVVLPILQFLILLLRRGWTTVRDRETHLLVMLPVSLLIPATLGVVLESPFGAVPFWWGLGAGLAILARRRTVAVRRTFGAVRRAGSS